MADPNNHNNYNYTDDGGGYEDGKFDDQGDYGFDDFQGQDQGQGGYADQDQGGYDDGQGQGQGQAYEDFLNQNQGPHDDQLPYDFDRQGEGGPYMDDIDEDDDRYEDGYNDEGAPLGHHDRDRYGHQQQYDDDGRAYEYEHDGGYEDRHGRNSGNPHPRDYYADEYGEDAYGDHDDDYDDGDRYLEEDEDERRAKARRRRAWCCCLLLMCCLLIAIILLIVFLLYMQTDDERVITEAPTFAPFIDDTDDDYFYDDDIVIAPGIVTSLMAPYDLDCDFDNQVGWPNVWDQCDCDGEITIVPPDVVQMRELLVERLLPKIYDANSSNYVNGAPNYALSSCDPVNMALLWLASGDMRDAGEIRQRFVMGLSFFGLNGTIWDYTDAWMTDLNECLWMGVQCNNRDTVNSMALDTNNIFGLVSTIHMYIYIRERSSSLLATCYSIPGR
jgi:hypothetical protein